MTERRSLPSLALLGGLTLATACTDRLDTGSTQEALIVPSAPFRFDSTLSIVPDLGVRGSLPSAAATVTDATAIHEATFSNGRDTISPGATSAAAWYPLAAGVDWTQFESAPAFTGELGTAVASASPTLGRLTDLSALATVLSSSALPIEISASAPTDAFYGWAPVQGRWLRSQYAVTSSTGAMTRQVYADPTFGGEIRERGARLYCAARRAQFEQAARPSSQTMGRQVALPLMILGHEVDLGVIEPTFTLDGPQRFTAAGANDGAQAFEVPMLLGTAVTPIDGIGLPGFGELRNPVVLVSGDTEVASAVAPSSLHTGDLTLCLPVAGCRTTPQFSTVSPRDYLTVTHADAALSRTSQLTVAIPPTPIFTIGILTLFIDGSGTVTIGGPSAAAPANDRLLTSTPSGWPVPPRTGDVSTSPWSPVFNYDTGPWGTLFGVDAPLSGTPTFGLPASGGTATFGTADPMLMRALADDDHHVASTTSVNLTVGGAVGVGFALGIAQLHLDGRAALGITFGQQTDVRDGALDLMGNGLGYPMTALTVTPSTSATVSATFSVALQIQINLGFTTIHKTYPIASLTTDKTWASAPWPQTNRALIATGSSFGDPTWQPWAVSHLPSSETPPSSPSFPAFNSFDQDVHACLADTTAYPPVPPACPPTATGGTPHGNLCLFSGSQPPNAQIGRGPASAWTGACSGVPAHVAAILPSGTPAQKACYTMVLNALCAPVSKEQDWHGQHGVARIIDMAHPNIDLGALTTQCVNAFAPTDATTTFNQIFDIAACDDTAQLLDASSVISTPPTPPGAPSPVSAGTCH